jgi:hypothetical protein
MSNRTSSSSQVLKIHHKVHLTSHKLSHNRFNHNICSSCKFISQNHNFICKINSHKIYSKIDTHKIHNHWSEFNFAKNEKNHCVVRYAGSRRLRPWLSRPAGRSTSRAGLCCRALRAAPTVARAGVPRRLVGGPHADGPACRPDGGPMRRPDVGLASPGPRRLASRVGSGPCALLHLRGSWKEMSREDGERERRSMGGVNWAWRNKR